MSRPPRNSTADRRIAALTLASLLQAWFSPARAQIPVQSPSHPIDSVSPSARDLIQAAAAEGELTQEQGMLARMAMAASFAHQVL